MYMHFYALQGFRLIAISLLPLGKDSLIYGSNDAGITIHRSNPKLNASLRIASARLNLKPHKAGELAHPLSVTHSLTHSLTH